MRIARTMSRRSGRSGFTLVELMVAMALSLFLMTILSEAFAVSMDTFRGLRAIGDMQDSLRTGLRQMRDDLSAAHFEGNRKLSDNGFFAEPRRDGFFYMKGSAPTLAGVDNVIEGYDGNTIASTRAVDHVLHFHTIRRSGNRPSNFFLGGSVLHAPFGPASTYRRRAYRAGQQFAGNLLLAGGDRHEHQPRRLRPRPRPPTSAPSGPRSPTSWNPFWIPCIRRQAPPAGSIDVATPGAAASSTPVNLYNLYRIEFLVLPYADGVSTNLVSATYLPAFSMWTSPVMTTPQFASPNDLANIGINRTFNPNTAVQIDTTRSPPLRYAGLPATQFKQLSLVASNVTSFQVSLIVQQAACSFPDPNQNPDPTYLEPNLVKDRVKPIVFLDDMPNYTYATNAAGPAIDSATTTTPPWAGPNGKGPPWTAATPPVGTGPPARIMGIQIRLRIYDPASGLSRQNTLVQAL